MRTNARRVARHALAATAILTLAGCAAPKGDELSQQASYAPAGADDGLIIYGIDISHNIGGRYVIHWQGIDETEKRYRADPGSTRKISMELHQMIWRNPPPLPRKFFVFRAKPGTYGLKQIQNIGDYGTFTIRFRPDTLAFRIKPGEVLYVGNFHLVFDQCGKFPFLRYCTENTKIVYGEPSLEEAKAALARFKNIKGEPRYYKLEPYELD